MAFLTTEPATNPWILDGIVRAIKADLAALDEGEMEKYRRYRSIGTQLNQAKDLMDHGRWLPWLRDNFRWSERQAQRFMEYANTTYTTDLRVEKAKWNKVNGNRARTDRTIRNAPPDDGSRSIEFPPGKITSVVGALFHDFVMDALRARFPDLDDAAIYSMALDRLYDQECCDGNAYTEYVPHSVELEDDGGVDRGPHRDVD